MNLEIIAEGLLFPEGPVILPDGDVLVVEVGRGTLTRVSADGATAVVAETGGGPNGAALAPDGSVIVCNNGGLEFRTVGRLTYTAGRSSAYLEGSIQRVDLATGRVESLYRECRGRALQAPNDLVFDAAGGFWFTDHGHSYGRLQDRTGVYYAAPDGSQIREVIFPLEGPNGVGLSPAGDVLYVAETMTGRLWAFDLEGPGRLAPTPRGPLGHHGRLVVGLPGVSLFDSLAVDAAGHVAVATLVDGPGITEISPSGEVVRRWSLPDPLPTNVAFDTSDPAWAYVTLSATGRLARFRWPRSGLPSVAGPA